MRKREYVSQLACPYTNTQRSIVLWQNKKYSIERYVNDNTGLNSLVVITDSTFTDWVMIYEPGKVAYDNPYKLPKYIKDKVVKFSLTLN